MNSEQSNNPCITNLKIFSEKCLYGTIYKYSPLGIEIYNSAGLLIDANDACLKIFGIDDFSHVKNFKLFEDPNLTSEIKKLLQKGESVRYEMVFDFELVKKQKLYPTKRSGEIYLDVTIVPSQQVFADAAGAYVVHLQDITERKKNADLVAVALREKEVLLKEIHHRVKNNLQIIQSLLSLQSKNISERNISGLFDASRGRISTIALIHEQLYLSSDLAYIEFKEYLKSLMEKIMANHIEDKVIFSLDMENLILDVNIAIPCALILNELVSNALKHAFPDGRKGLISAGVCKIREGMLELTVADNGVGLPAEVELGSIKTLGLEVVNVLTKQIGGNLKVFRGKGTRFSITFLNKGTRNG
ncbi:MAG: hypothetical protein HYV97_01525 [Bdellovibrio sp.]|nr:hypothetical protein [Bdellovibrio sp.]